MIYKTFYTAASEIEAYLNKFVSGDWKLHSIVPVPSGQLLVVYYKEKF